MATVTVVMLFLHSNLQTTTCYSRLHTRWTLFSGRFLLLRQFQIGSRRSKRVVNPKYARFTTAIVTKVQWRINHSLIHLFNHIPCLLHLLFHPVIFLLLSGLGYRVRRGLSHFSFFLILFLTTSISWGHCRWGCCARLAFFNRSTHSGRRRSIGYKELRGVTRTGINIEIYAKESLMIKLANNSLFFW